MIVLAICPYCGRTSSVQIRNDTKGLFYYTCDCGRLVEKVREW